MAPDPPVQLYVETNFFLEMVLRQEQQESCRRILDLAESGSVRVAIPAFSLAEPHDTLHRRHRSNESLFREIEQAATQLQRDARRDQPVRQMVDLAKRLLIGTVQEDVTALAEVQRRILEISDVIPLDGEVVAEGDRLQQECDLSAPDGLVLASVLKHLRETRPRVSRFLNRNVTDFGTRNVRDRLKEHGCELIFDFTQGLAFARNYLPQG